MGFARETQKKTEIDNFFIKYDEIGRFFEKKVVP